MQSEPHMHTPHQLVVRLGEDFNWWLAPTPDDAETPQDAHGVLDPRQVRELSERLNEYRAHGLDPQAAALAFCFYAVEAEIAEGTLQLKIGEDGDDLFALPLIDEDGDGPYIDFLDALGAARINRINTEHHHAKPCTLEEMQEELDAVDHNRYFNADTIHAFDQITEILDWSPAEWDQP